MFGHLKLMFQMDLGYEAIQIAVYFPMLLYCITMTEHSSTSSEQGRRLNIHINTLVLFICINSKNYYR